jgi:hypothetical protein
MEMTKIDSNTLNTIINYSAKSTFLIFDFSDK